jgi:hypothetical protein
VCGTLLSLLPRASGHVPNLTITAPRSPHDIRIGRKVWLWLRGHRAATFSYDGTHVRVSMPYASADDLSLALDAVTAWNWAALRVAPLPPIYESGVRYQREPVCRTGGREHICEEWLTAHEAFRRGVADCDDLGPWRAADLRMLGEAARAIPKRVRPGWHIVVRRGDGTIDDPSARLGMETDA